MSVFDYFWILFIIAAILPVFRRQLIDSTRIRTLRMLEKKRESRVITLIHRQEALSFLGIPLSRYIDIEDSEDILRAIHLTPKDLPIDLILHTPGGLVLAAEQIAMALNEHPGKVTVLIPHYAMSGGTMLALAADEIVMDRNAVLGPVDPQIGEYPAISILKVVEEKDKNKIDDRTLIFADIARKAITQVFNFVRSILIDNFGEEKANEIAKALTEGRWTHDYPISFKEAKEMGLKVVDGLPEEVFDLMKLYPQTIQRRPSVSYIPLPYPSPGHRPQDKK
jgi:ClpP class serine protease